ncbi:ComF family protein [Candidatus Saccharibacteria bacterium]|nr:ComF family protein [Candidatus Saccharibacteria bacterium]
MGCGAIGQPLCDRCKNNILKHHENFCPVCKAKTPSGYCEKCEILPPIFELSPRSGLIEKLIHSYKYDSTRALARPLAEMLHEILPPLPKNTVIIPLPTSTKHIRERGFDHTLAIAKNLAALRHFSVATPLIRAKNTVQVGADKESRLTQADTAYTVQNGFKANPDTTYLLLDDVWTTGASMKSAIKKFLDSGVQKNQFIITLLAAAPD